MTKVAIKNENITSFGGIYHIMDVFSKLGFEKLTESVLGKRGSSGKAFSHGSIFGSLFFSYLCGGECLEDINALIGQFKQRPDTLLPGADTVGRGLKELAEKSIVYKSETSDKSYSFNTAEKLNTLLLRMIRRMGLIKDTQSRCPYCKVGRYISSSPCPYIPFARVLAHAGCRPRYKGSVWCPNPQSLQARGVRCQ